MLYRIFESPISTVCEKRKCGYFDRNPWLTELNVTPNRCTGEKIYLCDSFHLNQIFKLPKNQPKSKSLFPSSNIRLKKDFLPKKGIGLKLDFLKTF